MIQVGDMVRLLDDDCYCEFCDTARGDYHKVLTVEEDKILLDMHYTKMAYLKEWTWDVQGQIEENE